MKENAYENNVNDEQIFHDDAIDAELGYPEDQTYYED